MIQKQLNKHMGGLVMKLTEQQIEQLAVEIRQFLLDNSLWIDVTIYFNGKAFSTCDDNGNYYYNSPEHLVILEDKDPTQYFKYVADPHILSMSFEGDFYGCLNFTCEFGEEFDNRIIKEFSDILAKYNLYYELGENWNLSCYPDNSEDYPTPKAKKEHISFYSDRRYPENAIIPEKLIEIQQVWKEKADAYGDVGSCVLGAGFNFTFGGQLYRMPPISCWQGSCSWESCIDEIRAMLTDAGATDINYDYGFMD